MELYRIPRRQVQARILLDDGRTLDGTVFTTDSVPGGRPEDVLHLLNDPTEDFVPLVCGDDSFLLNKTGIIWVQLTGETAAEVAEQSESGRPPGPASAVKSRPSSDRPSSKRMRTAVSRRGIR